MKSREPEQSYLNSILRYEDGKIYWTRITNNRMSATKEAGSDKPDGYREIRIDGVKYEYHRIVYTMRHGRIPDGMLVDHKDNDHKNNAEDNLQLSEYRQNNVKRVNMRKSGTGHRNIYLTDRGTYRVRFSINKSTKSFGTYKTLEEAIPVRDKVANEINGKFALLD